MTVFKRPSIREDHKLVGASLPSRVHAYMTLYSLAKGITKSKILKNLVEDWMVQKRAKETDSDLIQQMIDRVNSQWLVEKVKPKSSFYEFKERTKTELAEKGVDEKYINLILADIQR